MFLTTIFLALLASSFALPPLIASSPSSSDRIVGGNVTTIEEVPYIASLHLSGVHACGCIVISETFLLTAGHCANAGLIFQFMVRLGSSFHAHYGTLRSLRSIHIHPQFEPRSLNFDFAMLQLLSPITFGSTIQPIQLPKMNEHFEDGWMTSTKGWGDTQNPNESRSQLRKVEKPIVNQEKCQLAYAGFNYITDR